MGFLYSQFLVSLPVPTTSFAGKTIIVTGSNIGLGKEAARHFTRLGAETVILAVRSLEKGEDAKRDIESSTGRTGVLRVMHLDMASHASVLSFADKVMKECPRIDVALLNAGVIPGTWQVFEKDEAMITVNVVSTFLLALTLLPKLEETAQKFSTRPTLTITASEVHAWARFEEREAAEGKLFERLAEEQPKYDPGERYHVSKLLEVFTVRALAERRSAKQIGVTINYVNPGLCHSGLARDAGWGAVVFKAVVARSTEAGSRNLVAAACLGPESHGQYVSDCAVAQPGPNVLSQAGYKDQERVWRELAVRLEGIKKGVTAGFEP